MTCVAGWLGPRAIGCAVLVHAASIAGVFVSPAPAAAHAAQTASGRGDVQGDAAKRPPRRPHTPPSRPANGAWGGDHLRIDVSDTGAQVEYDCGRGEITGPLDLSKGRFDNLGTFLRTGPTKTVTGRSPAPRPARYQGSVTKNRMTVTITLTDKLQQIGTFTLSQGREAHLLRCP